MQKQNYLSKIFLFILYGAVAVFAYFYINRSPCDTPVTYSIGRIDSQFGISKSDVENYTAQASNLWNSSLQKTLLKENTPSDITVNFIFDERQRATIQAEKIKAEIADQKQNLDQLKATIDSLKTEYDSKLSVYNNQKNSYEKDLAAYNSSVDYWNSRGGAPKNEYNKLNTQKTNLETQYNSLNASLNELQSLATEIKMYSETHNNIVNQVNSAVSQVNANAGKEFEEGVYDSGKNTITIYEYESITGLKRVLAHELGHALGINHVSNKKSIMYYLNNAPDFKLSSEDATALKKVCKIN